MIPQEQKNARRSPQPQPNQHRPSTGAYLDEAADQPFEEAAVLPEEEEEEMVEEVFPTEGHRKTRTRQEEYQERHRPYPTPLTSSSVSHHKYSRGTERRQKTSYYNGGHTAEPTETTPRWQFPSRKP